MSRTDHLLQLIKNLTPVEVFDFYDGPRFYSCRDIVGQMFLVYWIDENENGASWLYLRVSPDRYAALKNGRIPIAYALSNPEEGSAFVVTGLPNTFDVLEISPNQIELDWLPPAGDRLQLETPTLPEKLAAAVDIARSINRQVFDIAFNKLRNTHEMGCGKLGRILESLQNTIYAFACDAEIDVRRVPEEIKQRAEMQVTGVFASSFGVRLQTRSEDLFSDDEVVRAIRAFNELIALLNSPEHVPAELHRFNILARSRFKHFLKVLIDSEVSIKADWGSPNGSTLQSEAAFEQISRTVRQLEQTDEAESRVATRPGRLVGIDVQSDLFVLVLEENEIIKGKLSGQLANRHFEVPSNVVAQLEETCVIDALTDRQKWSYVLMDLR